MSTGGYGEGYVDRRHPHAYVHELLAGVESSVGGLHASLFAGRGFAPFGWLRFSEDGKTLFAISAMRPGDNKSVVRGFDVATAALKSKMGIDGLNYATRLITDDRCLIGLSDGGAHVDFICDVGYATALLDELDDKGLIDHDLWCIDGSVIRASRAAAGAGKKGGCLQAAGRAQGDANARAA